MIVEHEQGQSQCGGGSSPPTPRKSIGGKGGEGGGERGKKEEEEEGRGRSPLSTRAGSATGPTPPYKLVRDTLNFQGGLTSS